MATLCVNVATIANELHALTALRANVMTIANEPRTLKKVALSAIAYTQTRSIHFSIMEKNRW